MSEVTKVKLPDDYQVFSFDGGIKGKLSFPVEVYFNCTKEELAEHFAAKGLFELIPLLDEEGFSFHPFSAEKLPVVPVEEELSTEEQAKAELESKKVGELKVLAKELEIDLGEAKLKGDIIAVILANLGTKEKMAEIEKGEETPNAEENKGEADPPTE